MRSLYRGDRFRFRQHLERRVPTGPSEPEPVLRAATAADVFPMASVFVSAWRGAYRGVVDDTILESLDRPAWAGRLRGLVSAPAAHTVAAGSNGSVIGFVRYGADPDDDWNGHVFALYVAPTHARLGIGRRLLDHAIAALEAQGHLTVTLWVFEANERARSFYARGDRARLFVRG